MTDAKAWEDRIQARASDDEDAALRRALALAAADDRGLVPTLLRTRDWETRVWLVNALPELLGQRAPPLLVDRYLRDRDPDIREEALRRLLELDPDAARRFLPRLRRQLESRDFYEPGDALWALLRLRDSEAIPLIEPMRSRSDYVGRIAEIVIAALRGDEAWIEARLLGHDHFATVWLARAASLLGTPRMCDLLRRGETDLPDDECRQFCADYAQQAPGT